MSILFFMALCVDIYWYIIKVVIYLAVTWGYLRVIRINNCYIIANY